MTSAMSTSRVRPGHFLLAITLGTACCGASAVAASSAIDKLYSHLVNANYNANVRPVVKHGDALDVQISFYITHFDVDEKTRQFNANLFFYQTWTDYRLQWNESEHEGLKTLHVPADKIWRPDLVLYNNAEYGDKFDSRGSVIALVMSSGSVIYVPPVQFPATCQFNLLRWPFDQQSCLLRVGSWTYHAGQINLQLGENGTGLRPNEDAVSVVNMDIVTDDTSPWKLTSTSVTIEKKVYKCCPEPYPSANVVVKLQRSSWLYRYTLIVPSFLVTLLTLATFFLPPSSSGKITIGLLDLLILCLYLIYLGTTLPPTSGDAPLIVVYFTATAIMVCLSVLLAVLTTNWVSYPRSHGPPALVMRVLAALDGFPLAACPLLPTAATAEPREGDAKPEKQWMSLSLAADRLAFWCYCLAVVFLMVQVHMA